MFSAQSDGLLTAPPRFSLLWLFCGSLGFAVGSEPRGLSPAQGPRVVLALPCHQAALFPSILSIRLPVPQDRNPNTTSTSNWEPLLPTTPEPPGASGHLYPQAREVSRGMHLDRMLLIPHSNLTFPGLSHGLESLRELGSPCFLFLLLALC